MVYASLSGGSERRRGIDPYRLFHRGDAWYLVGRCHVHDELRTFRLDRIRELKMLDERFRVPEDFSLDDYLEDVWSVFRGGRIYDIVLRFDGDLAPLIQNAEHHTSEEVQAVAGGELEYRVRLNHLDESAFDPFTGLGASIELEFTEVQLGVRKLWDRSRTVRPYIGGGLSYLTADISASVSDPFFSISVTDDDSSFGIWAGGGLYWTLGEAFNVGLDVRHSLNEVHFGDLDVDAGTHAGLLLGYHW